MGVLLDSCCGQEWGTSGQPDQDHVPTRVGGGAASREGASGRCPRGGWHFRTPRLCFLNGDVMPTAVLVA